MPRRSALVTGGAGFIGGRLAETLAATGWSVRVIDSLTDYYDPAIKRARVDALRGVGVDVIEGDLNDLDLDIALAGVDVVFHLAGQPGVRKSWGTDFGSYTRDNISATQRLLEAAWTASVDRFVYSSSSSVYGEAESFPTIESVAPRPVSPYGVTKLAGEHLVYLYGRSYLVPTVSLRYFTVYGPGQRPDMGFERFLRAAIAGDEIQVYGNGEQIRDVTYVDDVVRANIAAAGTALPPGAVYNVSGGSTVSINRVLEVIERIHGAPIRVAYGAVALGDVMHTSGSTAAFREVTGWTPEVDLETGLRRQYSWIRRSLDSGAVSTG